MPDDGRLLLAVEIGGTKLQLALGRSDGSIVALERRVIQPEAGATGILAQIAETYPLLLQQDGARGEKPIAVGIGFGGPVDVPSGITLLSHQIAGWENFPLAQWFARDIGVARVVVGNDADVAGLGEARFGAGVGFDPVFYVTIGSGIGGGLILNRRVYAGSAGGAAEIGHLWVEGLEGASRLEDLASGWAIGRRARARLRPGSALDRIVGGDAARVDAVAVAQAAREGDLDARAVLEQATEALGTALAHVVTLLGPRRIILGGGVSLLGEEQWFAPIRERLASRCFPPFRGSYDVVPAALGEAVVLHGALALASDLDPDEAKSHRSEKS
jgi:glucokinase